MKTVFAALNALVAQGFITAYAIGGAIGASFYLQAMQTEDVDAFVFLPSTDSVLISLTPVYQALTALGGELEREYVRFGQWPLQILTDATPLIAEAIREAVSVDYEGVPTRVFRSEYLCAIALDTGRSKDFTRVSMFLEQNEVDYDALQVLASRFRLQDQLDRVRHENL
jgi:hypothetical protein